METHPAQPHLSQITREGISCRECQHADERARGTWIKAHPFSFAFRWPLHRFASSSPGLGKGPHSKGSWNMSPSCKSTSCSLIWLKRCTEKKWESSSILAKITSSHPSAPPWASVCGYLHHHPTPSQTACNIRASCCVQPIQLDQLKENCFPNIGSHDLLRGSYPRLGLKFCCVHAFVHACVHACMCAQTYTYCCQ